MNEYDAKNPPAATDGLSQGNNTESFCNRIRMTFKVSPEHFQCLGEAPTGNPERQKESNMDNPTLNIGGLHLSVQVTGMHEALEKTNQLVAALNLAKSLIVELSSMKVDIQFGSQGQHLLSANPCPEPEPEDV